MHDPFAAQLKISDSETEFWNKAFLASNSF